MTYILFLVFILGFLLCGENQELGGDSVSDSYCNYTCDAIVTIPSQVYGIAKLVSQVLFCDHDEAIVYWIRIIVFRIFDNCILPYTVGSYGGRKW